MVAHNLLYYIAPAALVLSLAFLYISLTAMRETFTGSATGTAAAPALDKLLLEEADLPPVASSVREVLVDSDGGEFLTQQLELLRTTREIYGELLEKMAANLAAAAESRDVAAYKQAAVEKIAAETGGVPPRFCDDERVERLLAADADGSALDRLGVCLPLKPAKYLVLLSYAAKMYMKQVDAAQQSLGPATGSAAEPAMEMPSFPPLAGVDGGGTMEGFSASATAMGPAALAAVAYTSSYKLDTPPKSSSGSAAAAAAASSLLATPFDNRLIAWKAAYDAESMKRIRAYLKYIRWARKQSGALEADLKSGAILKQSVGPTAPLA